MKLFFIYYKIIYLTNMALECVHQHVCERMLASACVLNFWVFYCFVKVFRAKEATKNWRFDIYVHEGQDSWHTGYFIMMNSSLRVWCFYLPCQDMFKEYVKMKSTTFGILWYQPLLTVLGSRYFVSSLIRLR